MYFNECTTIDINNKKLIDMKIAFKIDIFNTETNTFEPYYFICKKDRRENKKLIEHANNKPYWFEGLYRGDWFRGGWYQYNCGFINPHRDKNRNVEGVVLDGEVWLLLNVTKEEPKNVEDIII